MHENKSRRRNEEKLKERNSEQQGFFIKWYVDNEYQQLAVNRCGFSVIALVYVIK